MTWLEPTWLVYPVIALLVLTALFAWSVRWWLNAFPVPVLNYQYERQYERPRAVATNFHQNWGYAVTATSASAIIPMLTREQVMHRRAMEDALWGHLPAVGS